jgi:hypothetical protein
VPGLPLGIAAACVIAAIMYTEYSPEHRAFILGVLAIFAMLCMIFACISWRQKYLGATDFDERFASMEESVRWLVEAKTITGAHIVRASAALNIVASSSITLLPNDEQARCWPHVRLEAQRFAVKLLRFVLAQQQKALYKNVREARAIEHAAVGTFQKRFDDEAQTIAANLNKYGRRGTYFSPPYDRLNGLLDRGPLDFADMRQVATCITDILKGDGYDAFQNSGSVPNS